MNSFFAIFLLLLPIISSYLENGFKTIHKLRQISLCCSPTVIRNDLIIRAAKGEKVDRTPVWLFRQAGRHLPEYNAYKKLKGKSFLDLLDDPTDVTECTMQPIRRYNVDAAILFSDILVILQAFGMKVTMPGGVGITVPEPFLSPNDMMEKISADIVVEDKLSHVIEAVRMIKKELKDEIPLIGFSAAPWTLMYYMVGGTSKKNQSVASTWLRIHPDASNHLLDSLTVVVIDYLSAQIEAGADLIQLFEAMGDFIDEKDFYDWAFPRLKKIAQSLKSKYPHIPLMVFPRGATYSIAKLQEAGYDVVTIDTSTDRRRARFLLSDSCKQVKPLRGFESGIQGNFDVKFLTDEYSDTRIVENEVRKLLEELGPQNLIANLGEGLSGKESPRLIETFVNAVHSISYDMIAKS
jgi:uroporphyrinogen decarboxylase